VETDSSALALRSAILRTPPMTSPVRFASALPELLLVLLFAEQAIEMLFTNHDEESSDLTGARFSARECLRAPKQTRAGLPR
jgi:hypothetical protein